MEFRGKTPTEVYSRVGIELLTAPQVQARGLTTRELLDVTLIVDDPSEHFISQRMEPIALRYAVGEFCFFITGRNDLAMIEHYSKFWSRISDDGKVVNSAYGKRLFIDENAHGARALQYALGTLEQDMFTRKAVLPIYHVNDSHESNDNPCTMFLQLVIRDSKLSCHAFMRSNDIWLGLPYDMFFFTLVQEIALVYLREECYPNLQIGPYYHHAVSMHLYERDIDVFGHSLYNLDTPVDVPALTARDVNTWFSHLCFFEEVTRKSSTCKPYLSTPFQEWCKTRLIGKQ